MNGLRDMLNEFYQNIPDWLRQPLISAINAAEDADEDQIITPLSQLIVLLDRGFNPNEAVNRYMTNPVTRRSATRRFFLPHTLPGNLYPEDLEIYLPTIPPSPPGDLVLQPASLDLPPPPSTAALIAAARVPPRIDSFFQPGVEDAIAAMAYQEPQAQAPRAARRTLPNDIEDGEIDQD